MIRPSSSPPRRRRAWSRRATRRGCRGTRPLASRPAACGRCRRRGVAKIPPSPTNAISAGVVRASERRAACHMAASYPFRAIQRKIPWAGRSRSAPAATGAAPVGRWQVDVHGHAVVEQFELVPELGLEDPRRGRAGAPWAGERPDHAGEPTLRVEGHLAREVRELKTGPWASLSAWCRRSTADRRENARARRRRPRHRPPSGRPTSRGPACLRRAAGRGPFARVAVQVRRRRRRSVTPLRGAPAVGAGPTARSRTRAERSSRVRRAASIALAVSARPCMTTC